MEETYHQIRERKISDLRKDNLTKFYERLCQNKLTKTDKFKLDQHYDRYRFLFTSYDDYISYCKSDIKNAHGLEVDPIKQGFDERLQMEIFSKKYSKKIEKLALRGNKALCITKNLVITSPSSNFRTGERTKSFDAIEKEADKTTYYAFKYTDQTGGAQDNQIKDIEMFLDFSQKYLDKNLDSKEFFIAVVAGKVMKNFSIQMNEKIKHAQIQIIYLD
jgi:hypothetical protein